MDTYIGLWLRDVPYIWLQTDDPTSTTILSGHIRKYLLPRIAYPRLLQHLNGTYTPLDAEYILPFSSLSTCSIEQLRMFMVYHSLKIEGFGMWVDKTNYEIRVNGRKVNIPQYLTSSTTATIYDVYDVLGLRFPTFEQLFDWQSTLMVKLTAPQPPPLFKRIRLPSSIPSDQRFKDRPSTTIDKGTLYRKWLDILLLRAYKISGNQRRAKICSPLAGGKGYESFAVIGDITSTAVSIRDTPLLYSLKECKDSKIVVIPVLWNLKKGNDAHMNLLILVSSILYVFDPWGSSFFEAQSIKKGVREILRKAGIEGVLDIVESERWCPKLSFQTLEGYDERGRLRPSQYKKGFCVVWVLWMIETLLINPNIPPAELPRLAIQRALDDEGSLRDTIESYAEAIQSLA